MRGRFENLIGRKFGRLTVVERASNGNRGEVRWKCVCDCGNSNVISRGNNLKGGTARSCGCLQRERAKEYNSTHGKYKTRIYNAWNSMKNRCYNQNHPNYKDYGGRGIVLCEEWKNDFMTFCSWAIENGYRDDLTIDRIDVNGIYEPSNCRWVTKTEQCYNKRDNQFVTYNGETLTITEWAEKLGINKKTLWGRLRRLNYDVDKAFSKNNLSEHKITYNGKTQSIVDWANEICINSRTLYTRLHKGWSIERALTTPVKKYNKKIT